jgi:hypothetical protein
MVCVLGFFLWRTNALGIDPFNWKLISSLGFGSASPSDLITVQAPPSMLYISTAFVANMAQFVFAVLYIPLNSLLTSMICAYDWSRFAQHKKPQRVTSPVYLQRSARPFNMPKRYAIVRIPQSFL